MKTRDKVFKNNDRVILPKGIYTDSADNPAWGGKYGKIMGTICYCETDYIRVKWDNKRINTYSDDELDLVSFDWDL